MTYRSLKTLEHAMKVMERVFEERIRKMVEIYKIEMQIMDAIFAVRQMINKYKKLGKK